MKYGQFVMTRGIAAKVKESTEFSIFVHNSVTKYLCGDWGDICREDWEMNDSAVENDDDRVVAKYNSHLGDIYIITEWDRSATTILFTEEY